MRAFNFVTVSLQIRWVFARFICTVNFSLASAETRAGPSLFPPV